MLQYEYPRFKSYETKWDSKPYLNTEILTDGMTSVLTRLTPRLRLHISLAEVICYTYVIVVSDTIGISTMAQGECKREDSQ